MVAKAEKFGKIRKFIAVAVVGSLPVLGVLGASVPAMAAKKYIVGGQFCANKPYRTGSGWACKTITRDVAEGQECMAKADGGYWGNYCATRKVVTPGTLPLDRQPVSGPAQAQ